MLEKTVEFQTVDGEDASITFKNTMRHDIRFTVMRERFAGDGHPDRNFRFDFCYALAHVHAASVPGWEPVDETATPDEFTACFHAFAEQVRSDTFYEIVRGLNDLKEPVADAVEKPEDALTAEQAADPN